MHETTSIFLIHQPASPYLYSVHPELASLSEVIGLSLTMRSGVEVVVLALCITLVRGGGGGGKATAMLVFGDSTVDPGNNNHLITVAKADYPPYGMDYAGRRATGRFSDGRLATDFISESLGISKSIPAFLDPELQLEQLKYGVSFASSSSGYDVLTASKAGVISFPEQINYLKHYKIHLRKLVGPIQAEQIIKNAIVIISAGSNDILVNYYLYPDRPKQFTIPQYTDYMISLLSNYTEEIHRVGAMRFVVVGLPPIGCVPIMRTLANTDGCFTKMNTAAISYNTKLVAQLDVLQKTLGVKTAYIDVYRSVIEAVKVPMKYGFLETKKGCCGSGMIEMADTCKGQTTCKDPSKYIFFDAIHPTERMYKLIAEEAMISIDKMVHG